MIYELRSYSFAPGHAAAYLARFQSQGLPLVTAHLPLLGYWLTEAGDLNVLHHLWVYSDFADRASRRARLAADRAWTMEFTPCAILPLVKTQRSRLLQLVYGSAPLKQAVGQADQHHNARAAEASVLAESYATLTVSETRVTEEITELVAIWRIVAGRNLGRHIVLHRFDQPESIVFGEGEHCDLMRPAVFSPL